jgi:altronate hydrolase
MTGAEEIWGFARDDGRAGIRNSILVVYTVECAHMVAGEIARAFVEDDVQVIGFGGCYPSAYAHHMLEQLCTHPNTAGVLLVSLGCEGFDRDRLADTVRASGRPVASLVIQDAGGTAIFEETGELIGCESHMAARAVTPQLGVQITRRVEKAADYYTRMGHGSFSPGNAEGGLTTLEEKSLGAYAKSGRGPIHGVITPGQVPPTPGLYLLDVVPEGDLRWGFPNINDNAEIAELIACGSHVVVFTTGRGSVVGSAISPVVKVCANPETYARMADDMDVNAGRILDGEASIDEVAAELMDVVVATATGRPSASEGLGHREFVLTYKSSEPAGPSCLPLAR